MSWCVSLSCLMTLVFQTGLTGCAAGASDVADAAMRGDKAMVRSLIQRRTDVSEPQADGTTALHWAVYKDDPELADLLIGAGAKVDAANREGITPVYMACMYGHVSMVGRLLKAGADAKQKGPTGETLLMLAARSGAGEAIGLL